MSGTLITFGAEVEKRFCLPKGLVADCLCLKTVLAQIETVITDPNMVIDVIKMWDDWRGDSFRDEPTPVEISDVLRRYLNDHADID